MCFERKKYTLEKNQFANFLNIINQSLTDIQEKHTHTHTNLQVCTQVTSLRVFNEISQLALNIFVSITRPRSCFLEYFNYLL